MMFVYKNKGQTTLEYAVLVTIVIAALFTIQGYVKKGVQGNMKSSTDDIGNQFSPGNTSHIMVETRKTSTKDTFGAATGVTGAAVGVSISDTTRDKTFSDTSTVVHGNEFYDRPGESDAGSGGSTLGSLADLTLPSASLTDTTDNDALDKTNRESLISSFSNDASGRRSTLTPPAP